MITKIIRWNLAGIVVLAVYGLATDEPYWRAVGHGPWLFDYAFWFALVMNGPSGFTADYLARHLSSSADDWFTMQYALWCAFLWPQWKLYHALTSWCRQTRARGLMLLGLVFFFTLVGGLAAWQAWLVGHRPSEFFVDRYFWFARVGGVACSGLVVLCVFALASKQSRQD